MTEFTTYPNDNPVFCDFETRSAANLNKVGGKRYLRDPSTQIMCLAALIDQTMHVWVPESAKVGCLELAGATAEDLMPNSEYTLGLHLGGRHVPKPMEDALADRVWIAHNAFNFDAMCWDNLLVNQGPVWYDTAFACRSNSLPGSLDKAAGVLGCGSKDAGGSEAMLRLSRAKVVKDRVFYDPGKFGDWITMVRYCVQDVLILAKLHQAVKLPKYEEKIVAADIAINLRGCPIDIKLACTLRELWAKHEAVSAEALSEETDGELTAENVRSVPQVKAYLARHGIHLDSLEKKKLEDFFLHPEDADGWDPGGNRDAPAVQHVVDVLKLRQSATRATKGKVDRALESADHDHRIRNMFVHGGAHTGRWTGKSMQPHNMARGVSELDMACLLSAHQEGKLTYELVKMAAEKAKCTVDAALATMFRPIVRASDGKLLVILDYGQVEARGVAWLSQDPDLLGLFADPKMDPYCDMAGHIYGRPITKADMKERFVGKQTVLGSGYAMSPTKFELLCKQSGIDLCAANTTPDACISSYRAAFPRVCASWKWLTYMAKRTVGMAPGPRPAITLNPRIEFSYHDGDLFIRLPSGRYLRYRNAHAETEKPGLNLVAAMERLGYPVPDTIDSVRYTHPRGYRSSLFGGLLMENVVQAMCRDMLAETLVWLEYMGYATVLHVHDEIVVEVDQHDAPTILSHIGQRMSCPPMWAPDFSMRVEGFVSKHYVKKALKGSPSVDTFRGEIL